jgi:hypothetical protein
LSILDKFANFACEFASAIFFKIFFNGYKRHPTTAINNGSLAALRLEAQQKQNGMLSLPR